MSMVIMLAMGKAMLNTNPTQLSVIILLVSLISAKTLWASGMTSWLTMVLILTFSSGMMTLFMYTASVTANEKSKTKKYTWVLIPVTAAALGVETPSTNNPHSQLFMKAFSSSFFMILAAMILITTMMSLSIQGYHPTQTMASSF